MAGEIMMIEPSIKFGENVTEVDERGNVNVTWKIVLTDVPADDAWQIALAVTAIVGGYEGKWRNAAEMKLDKASEMLGEDWKLGTTPEEDVVIPEGSNLPYDTPQEETKDDDDYPRKPNVLDMPIANFTVDGEAFALPEDHYQI